MLRAVVAIGLLLIAMFAFGPTVHLDLDGEAARARPIPTTPDELEAFLSQENLAIKNAVPDTDAQIRWHAPESPGRQPWAVVYLHGFSASRQETAPLAQLLADSLKANLFEARFTGHGQPGSALASATPEAWLRDAKEGIAIGRALGDRVLVLAASTGATLAIISAAQEPEAEDTAFAFISPNFGPRAFASRLLLWPWARTWIPWVAGTERSWEPENPEQGKYWTTSYPIEALFPMMASVKASGLVDVGRIKAPIHIFLSEQDPTVDPARTRKMFERFSSSAAKRLTEVEGPGDHHVLAGDILAPARTGTIAKDILDWVDSLP